MDATKTHAQKLEAKGKPVDFKELLRLEPDGGVTNIRNVSSSHWRRWLEPASRCLVPFTSFSEYDTIDGKKTPVWFASDDSRPLLCFAGLWTNWTSVRKAKEGEVTSDIFAFLTCEPNAEVGGRIRRRCRCATRGCGRAGRKPRRFSARFRTAPSELSPPARMMKVESRAEDSPRQRKIIHIDMDAFYG
jgi:hypothetical protein